MDHPNGSPSFGAHSYGSGGSAHGQQQVLALAGDLQQQRLRNDADDHMNAASRALMSMQMNKHLMGMSAAARPFCTDLMDQLEQIGRDHAISLVGGVMTELDRVSSECKNDALTSINTTFHEANVEAERKLAATKRLFEAAIAALEQKSNVADELAREYEAVIRARKSRIEDIEAEMAAQDAELDASVRKTRGLIGKHQQLQASLDQQNTIAQQTFSNLQNSIQQAVQGSHTMISEMMSEQAIAQSAMVRAAAAVQIVQQPEVLSGFSMNNHAATSAARASGLAGLGRLRGSGFPLHPHGNMAASPSARAGSAHDGDPLFAASQAHNDGGASDLGDLFRDFTMNPNLGGGGGAMPAPVR